MKTIILKNFYKYNIIYIKINRSDSIYCQEMQILVKHLRKFLFCEDPKLHNQLKQLLNTHSEDSAQLASLTYFELLIEVLEKKGFPSVFNWKIPEKSQFTIETGRNSVKSPIKNLAKVRKSMKEQENDDEKKDFEGILQELEAQNKNLMNENLKNKEFLKELKSEVDRIGDLVKNWKNEAECEVFLRENVDLRLVVVKLKEV